MQPRVLSSVHRSICGDTKAQREVSEQTCILHLCISHGLVLAHSARELQPQSTPLRA